MVSASFAFQRTVRIRESGMQTKRVLVNAGKFPRRCTKPHAKVGTGRPSDVSIFRAGNKEPALP